MPTSFHSGGRGVGAIGGPPITAYEQLKSRSHAKYHVGPGPSEEAYENVRPPTAATQTRAVSGLPTRTKAEHAVPSRLNLSSRKAFAPLRSSDVGEKKPEMKKKRLMKYDWLSIRKGTPKKALKADG